MPVRRPSKKRLGVAVCAVALVLIGFAFAMSPALRDRVLPRPNIVLIVIDSLRADRVDLRGVPGGLTPFLAELATKSTVYERAYAPSSWTIPVVASLMTGQYPSEHRATNFFSRLDQGTPTLAELLARRGYATTGVVANAALREDHGFARGFEHFKLVGEPDFLNPKSDGWLLIDQVLRWVDEPGPRRPQFLYLHFMDVHMPYRTQEGLSPPAPASIRSDGELSSRWCARNGTSRTRRCSASRTCTTARCATKTRSCAPCSASWPHADSSTMRSSRSSPTTARSSASTRSSVTAPR